MFSTIETEIITALKSNLTTVPKENIVRQPDLKRGILPAVSVSSSDFTLDQEAMGSGFGTTKETIMDQFEGDGKKTMFNLSQKPIRPIISVETPIGTFKKEPEDYTVNYSKGVIVMRSPPDKGKTNVRVQYCSTKSAGETRSIKITITYHLDVWAKDEVERDLVTVDVIRTLLLAQEDIATKDIRINPRKGLTLPPEEGPKNQSALGKRLIYDFETRLRVEIPVPKIEEIKEKVERERIE